MIPLVQALAPADLLHVARLVRPDSPAGRFLRDRTYVDDESAPPLRSLEAAERETLLSELAWRVTCFLDGSTTQVPGMNEFPLGSGFLAVWRRTAEGDIFRLRHGPGD